VRSQIKLGRIFGIEIGLHYSWFFIALLIVFSLFQQFHAENQNWGNAIILTLSIATALLFFVSLLLHELSHSLFARSRGTHLDGTPSGGRDRCCVHVTVRGRTMKPRRKNSV
jgi:Zn-dependent protease